MIAGAYAVLWVRQDGPGNDACRFAEAEGGFLIDGSSTDACDQRLVRANSLRGQSSSMVKTVVCHYVSSSYTLPYIPLATAPSTLSGLVP